MANRKFPAAIEADFIQKVYDLVLSGTDVHPDLYNEYYRRLTDAAQTGWGRSWWNPETLTEAEHIERMRRNLASFSAHKAQAALAEARAYLYDADGNKRPKAQFEELARGTMRRHNRTYLRAELDTATGAAAQAEGWQRFTSRAYLYPNLRYETVGDERVREEHKTMDGAVYPLDSPFWDTYYPPNGWRCRCIVIQTDDPVKEQEAGWTPSKGFNQNVGKTMQLFGEDHPYFKVSKASADRIEAQGKKLRAAQEKPQVQSIVKEKYIDKGVEFSPVGLPIPFKLNSKSLGHVLASEHPEEATRNALLTVLDLAIPRMTFQQTSSPRTDDVGSWNYWWYTFTWLEEFFINIRSLKVENVSYELWEITDKID